jgi:mannose-6-phosphate isomerase-like protein (cupin superfamily)
MKASKDNPTRVEEAGPVTAVFGELGDYTVNFMTLHVDLDMTPLLRGLPGDRCTAEHWGYVIKGSMTFRYADHEETVKAGEAFYATPGHVPITNEPGTEYVQFTPTEQMRPVDEAIQRNLAAMQPAS